MTIFKRSKKERDKILEGIDELARERNAFLLQRNALAKALKDRGEDPELVLRDALKERRAAEKSEQDG